MQPLVVTAYDDAVLGDGRRRHERKCTVAITPFDSAPLQINRQELVLVMSHVKFPVSHRAGRGDLRPGFDLLELLSVRNAEHMHDRIAASKRGHSIANRG